MKVEITPELLDNLKRKAEMAIAGPWLDDIDAEKNYGILSDSNRIYANIRSNDAPVYGILASVNPNLKLCDVTSKYIASANPAVMLALIAKIEQLEKESDWLVDKMNDCPEQMDGKYCPYDDTEFLPLNILPIIPKWVCKKCWRNAAKEAIKANEQADK